MPFLVLPSCPGLGVEYDETRTPTVLSPTCTALLKNVLNSGVLGGGNMIVQTASYRESQPSLLFWGPSSHHILFIGLFVVLWGQQICFLERQVAFSILQPSVCFIIHLSLFLFLGFFFNLSALVSSTSLFILVGLWLLPFFFLFLSLYCHVS